MLSKFSFFHRFLNLMSLSSDLVFITRVNGVVFWPHLGTVKCKSRASPPRPTGLLTGPLKPSAAKRNDLSCLWHDKTQLKILLLLPKPQNSFCANLQLAECVWAVHQIRALFQVFRCKIGPPRRIFTYLPENI